MYNYTLFEKGTLLRRIVDVSEKALAAGALLPIDTCSDFIEEKGVSFVVRILTNLVRKDEDRLKRAQSKKSNPFLPYERELFVADISETHLALLNKFNVMNRHLLIVTRAFESQENLLTPADFSALWTCMSEYEALGFYNGGEAAGASQPHKHLQMVPLPLTDQGPSVPIQPFLDKTEDKGNITRIPAFSFRHCFARFRHNNNSVVPCSPVEQSYDLYKAMLSELRMSIPNEKKAVQQSGPYCLLITRQWMMLVPRSLEFYHGISVNSLGFSGCLLVRNQEQLELIKKIGPLHLLRAVALPF